MAVRARGFTLTELVVVTAILAVLAATLMPVFARAKKAAHASQCASNFRQTVVAASLYQGDYDENHVIARYRTADQEIDPNDRLWPQLVLPYLRDLRASHCPSDHTHDWSSEAVFDEDLVVGDTWARFYRTAQRVNTGYNAVYLAPLVRTSAGWMSLTRNSSALANPAATLVFGDSVWQVTDDGKPTGGGNYLVVPPCRYTQENRFDTFELTGVNNDSIYRGERTWDRTRQYGGLWEWHEEKLTVAYADGHVERRSIERLVQGCTPSPNWSGAVFDPARYLWDLR